MKNLWYLDHAYGKDSDIFKIITNIKPGVYDSEVGEALINQHVHTRNIDDTTLLDEINATKDENGGENDITNDTVWSMFNRYNDQLHIIFPTVYDEFKSMVKEWMPSTIKADGPIPYISHIIHNTTKI